MRHPLRGGIMHRAGARIRLAGKSLKTLRRSIFFTRPLMAHQRNALLESRAFFLYVENHSLGEWFQRRLVPMMKTEKLLLL